MTADRLRTRSPALGRYALWVPVSLDLHDVAKEKTMLWTIALILLVLWILGLVSSYTVGGFIHILLVVAIVMVLINVIGRRGR